MQILTITPEEIRVIRTLIPDQEEVFDGQTMFNDQDITDYYIAGRGSVLRAAGFAKIAIGDSEALISKVIRTQDLQTDGAKVAEAFRKSGEALLKRADDEDVLDNGFYSDIVPFGWDNRVPELTEWNWNVSS